ncbi:566_t:CDS:2 [Paraglomus occultum]|uniref:DNA-binding protein RAP1 n=1 Tax=Paraglomus occultum TaxID=144539 RepID=A0A9N8WKF3_9GLOM|nr:566_t:CDS:2 [Paraglomus occultum]
MKIKQRRHQFIAAEDDVLREYVKKQHDEGKAIRGLKIYRALAEEHPTHTAQSWRDRAIRQVVQVIEDESYEEESAVVYRKIKAAVVAGNLRRVAGSPRSVAAPPSQSQSAAEKKPPPGHMARASHGKNSDNEEKKTLIGYKKFIAGKLDCPSSRRSSNVTKAKPQPSHQKKTHPLHQRGQ